TWNHSEQPVVLVVRHVERSVGAERHAGRRRKPQPSRREVLDRAVGVQSPDAGGPGLTLELRDEDGTVVGDGQPTRLPVVRLEHCRDHFFPVDNAYAVVFWVGDVDAAVRTDGEAFTQPAERRLDGGAAVAVEPRGAGAGHGRDRSLTVDPAHAGS